VSKIKRESQLRKLEKLLLLLLTLSALAASFAPAWAQVLLEPRDFTKVDFYLHTVDVGQEIPAKYGHTQIRMHDRSTGQDIAVSWGLFDFNKPNFIWNFYKGFLTYEIGAFSMRQAQNIYHFNNRHVWEDKIHLSVKQKRRLFEKMAHDLLPENSSYQYDIFFDNCSTRPRDFIDHALLGQVRAAVAGVLTQESFRDMVREHQATTPLTGMGLELIVNARLDRRMTAWEQMFLPMRLRSVLQEMPQVDDQGNPVEGTKLLSFVREIVVAPAPAASYLIDDLLVWLLFGLPLALIFLRSYFSPASAQRLFGGYLFSWGLFSGFLGTLMLMNWLVSEHLVTHHNANLMIFWPLDFLFVRLGWHWLRARPRPDHAAARSWRWRHAAYLLCVAHMVSLAVLALLHLLGWVEQDVGRVLLSFGLIAFCLYYFCAFLLRAERSRT